MDAMKTHGAFSWMELQIEEPGQVKDFYRDVIGWQLLDMPMQDGSTYSGFALGEQPLGGFSNKSNPKPAWLPYVTVDDVDTRAGKVEAAGGEIVTAPFDAPGVGRIAVVRDPAGAPLALITYPASATS